MGRRNSEGGAQRDEGEGHVQTVKYVAELMHGILTVKYKIGNSTVKVAPA